MIGQKKAVVLQIRPISTEIFRTYQRGAVLPVAAHVGPDAARGRCAASPLSHNASGYFTIAIKLDRNWSSGYSLKLSMFD
jgi:hypothetical protein